MALGGGTFTTQNKILPGAYINFVSAAKAYTIGERGVAALPVQLDWGPEGKVFEVTADDFERYSLKLFGYTADDERVKGIRDLFKHCEKAYFYRLNTGAKATCTYADAKYSGTKGNDLKIVIKQDVDEEESYHVQTLMGFQVVDEQIVNQQADLIDNDYVTWKKEATLQETASTPLTSGTSGEPVTGTEYQAALDAFESYKFNALGCLATTDEIKKLFVSYTKRMRDQAGYADKCEVQLAYAIGVVQPVGVSVECFGTEHQSLDFIEAYVHDSYDLTPQGIIKRLGLLDVDYNKRSLRQGWSSVGGLTHAVQTKDTVPSPRLSGAGGSRPALL